MGLSDECSRADGRESGPVGCQDISKRKMCPVDCWEGNSQRVPGDSGINCGERVRGIDGCVSGCDVLGKIMHQEQERPCIRLIV